MKISPGNKSDPSLLAALPCVSYRFHERNKPLTRLATLMTDAGFRNSQAIGNNASAEGSSPLRTQRMEVRIQLRSARP